MRLHAFPDIRELPSSRHAPAQKAFSSLLLCPHLSCEQLGKFMEKNLQANANSLDVYSSQGFWDLRLAHTLLLAIR